MEIFEYILGGFVSIYYTTKKILLRFGIKLEHELTSFDIECIKRV